MKDIDALKLTVLPLGMLVILAIFWKMTHSVGAAISIIIFWMSWRQLLKKINTN